MRITPRKVLNWKNQICDTIVHDHWTTYKKYRVYGWCYYFVHWNYNHHSVVIVTIQSVIYASKCNIRVLVPVNIIVKLINNNFSPELTVLVSASTDSVFGFFDSSSLSSSATSVCLLGVELALALSSSGLPVSGGAPCDVGGLSTLIARLFIGADILGTELIFSWSLDLSARASSGSESSCVVAGCGLWHPWRLLRQWCTLCSIKRTISLRG